MVKLSRDEKVEMCERLSKHIVKIRELLHVTQAEFSELCGFSRTRISQIENGLITMTWSQLTSVMFICLVNFRTKEYCYANNLLSTRFLQYVQRKDENIPPEVNVAVREDFIAAYQKSMSSTED